MSAAHSVTPPLEWARGYHVRGWRPVPAPFRSKHPILDGWPDLAIPYDELPKFFYANGKRQNICIVLGEISDVDLDAPEACRLGPLLLPPTAAVFGRQSKPRSHHLYMAKDPAVPAPLKLEWPGTEKPIVELRSNKLQTVFPGSAHDKTGEEIRWDSEGEPAAIGADRLTRVVRHIAAGCLLLPHWREGQRHKLQMALSGALLRAGWAQNDTIQFIWAVARAGGQDDPKVSTDIVRIVRDAGARLQAERSVYGLRTIGDIVGDEATLSKFAEWLGLGNGKGTAPEADAGEGMTAPVWDEPVALTEVQCPPFPLRVLPEWMRTYTIALATAKQTPVDLAVWQTVAALSAALAGRAIVRVKGDYYETANIWVCSILESGERKTPVVLATRKPIQEWEKERIKAAEPEIAKQESARRTLEARLRHLEAEAAKAPPAESAKKEAAALAAAHTLAAFKVPTKPRYLTDDCTPERLGTLLVENEERMAVLSDEGTIFPMIFGRYSSAPNYEIYLKSYQGSPHPIDRGSRAGEILEEPLLTMGLSVQPEVIKGLAAQPDARGRGLVGRFIYSRPESLLGRRPGDAPPLDPQLQQDYADRLRRLLALEHVVVDGRSCARTLTLSAEAYACWVRLHDALEEEMGRDGAFHGFTDWAGKLCGQVVRVAGILHMAEHATRGGDWPAEISEATFRAAIPIGLYMIQHARAALGMMRSAVGHEDARKVLAWIMGREGDPSADFKRTDAIRGTRLAAEDLTKALGVLEEHGHIQPAPGEREKSRGPVPAKYLVNPALAKGEAQAQRRRPFRAVLALFPEEATGMLLGETDNSSNPSNYSEAPEPAASARPGALDALFPRAPQADNSSNSSNSSEGHTRQEGDGGGEAGSVEPFTLAWPCCGGSVSRFSAKRGGSVCARCHPDD